MTAVPYRSSARLLGVDRGPMARTSPTTISRAPIVAPLTIQAARGGDPAAVGRMATAVYRRLLAFYRYSGLRPDEAEDLAADAMEAVITKLQDLRRPESFDSWVWAIGRTKLRGFLRTERRPRAVEPMPVVAPDPAEVTVLNEEHADIRAALARLSDRDKELLWLREVEGLSYGEIGSRLGAASGAVRVACMRARRRLQRAYEQPLPHDGRDTRGERPT